MVKRAQEKFFIFFRGLFPGKIFLHGSFLDAPPYFRVLKHFISPHKSSQKSEFIVISEYEARAGVCFGSMIFDTVGQGPDFSHYRDYSVAHWFHLGQAARFESWRDKYGIRPGVNSMRQDVVKRKMRCHIIVFFTQFAEKLFGRNAEVLTPESLSPHLGPKITKQVEYVQTS